MPIYGVIKPASIKAARVTRNNRIGIMATTATVRSDAYPRTIHRYSEEAEVFQLACPLLVPLVENGRYRKDDIVVTTVLQEYLDQLLVHDVDTIVLGCTHYPLLMDAISSLVPDLNIISSSEAAAETLRRSLIEQDLLKETPGSTRRYYVSDDPDHFHENAVLFLGDEIQAEAELVRV